MWYTRTIQQTTQLWYTNVFHRNFTAVSSGHTLSKSSLTPSWNSHILWASSQLFHQALNQSYSCTSKNKKPPRKPHSISLIIVYCKSQRQTGRNKITWPDWLWFISVQNLLNFILLWLDIFQSSLRASCQDWGTWRWNLQDLYQILVSWSHRSTKSRRSFGHWHTMFYLQERVPLA